MQNHRTKEDIQDYNYNLVVPKYQSYRAWEDGHCFEKNLLANGPHTISLNPWANRTHDWVLLLVFMKGKI